MSMIQKTQAILGLLNEEAGAGQASVEEIETALVQALEDQGVIDAIVTVEDDMMGIELETESGIVIDATVIEDEDGVIYCNAFAEDQDFETSFPATTVDGAISLEELPFDWFGEIIARLSGDGDTFAEHYLPLIHEAKKMFKVVAGKVVKIKKRKKLTPAQRRALAQNLKKARQSLRTDPDAKKKRAKSMALRSRKGL